jgi:hypothetical protein
MLSTNPRLASRVRAAVLLCLVAGECLLVSQRLAADPPAPSSDGGGKSPAAKAPPAVRPDEAERRKIIDSPEWHSMQYGLHEWLSVQQVYTPTQLRKVKAELNAKVARMTPEELVDFMADMNQKLKILRGKEAEQARLWVEQKLATQVNLTPAQLKQMRPDVLNMTAAQLQETLDLWQAQRQNTIATQKAFEKGKATQIANIEAMEKDEEHERDEALNRAYYDMSNGSPYGGVYGGGGGLNNPTWFRGGWGYYPSYRW